MRTADGMMRQFCRWCEDEYGHEYNPHGEWMRRTSESLALVEQAERDHDLKHHTPAFLKAGAP
jgi:hypothetical protein